ncbi:hypothetical protein LJC47_00245 [Desulfosarcina sp. OttesenSCG-928-B08]|nr:hypothetical protein [Desulfosarcina sp. OttesenSCG-928-B08]
MAERNTAYKDGELIPLPVADATLIEGGNMVAVNADGYAVPAADEASLVVMGIADDTADNGNGINGDTVVLVRRKKAFLLDNNGITQAGVGRSVCVSDAHTVTTAATATNDITAGICLGIEDDGAWIYIG